MTGFYLVFGSVETNLTWIMSNFQTDDFIQ